MVKFNCLLVLPFLLFQSCPQTVPGPPIQIKTRIVNIEDLFSSFVDGFCSKCGPASTQCQQNFFYVKTNPFTMFSPENITKNPNNVTQLKYVIQSVNDSYSFPKKELIDAPMDYIIDMPLNIQKINGVILYFHPTVFGITQIPTHKGTQISAIAALYVSSGYAIVFPDYLGYAYSSAYPHPYVMYPQQNVKSAINALNRALGTIKSQYPSMSSFPLFAVGYSEGASYAAWFEKCIQSQQNCQGAKLNSDYIYKASAGMDGPYQLENVVKPFLMQEVRHTIDNNFKIQSQLMTNFGKPPLLAMTLISYLYFSLGQIDYKSQIINFLFWAMRCSGVLNQTKCQIDNEQFQNLFKAIKSKKASLDVAEAISYSAFQKKYTTAQKYLGSQVLQYATQFTNSVFSLVNKTLIISESFNQTLQNSSAINNQPLKKIFLFSLKRDSIVPVNNTESFQNKYGKNRVEAYYFQNKYHKVCKKKGGSAQVVDHSGAQVLANVFVLAFLRTVG